MAKRTLIIEVATDRAEELIAALSKRPYIRILSLDRRQRKEMGSCPACNRQFTKESIVSVNAEMLGFLVNMLRRMKIAKSVVLVNKRNPVDKVPLQERERAVPFPAPLAEKAELLGLISKCYDGSTETHYVTNRGLSFLNGDTALRPSKLIVADGKILEQDGELLVENVRFSDRIDHDKLLREAKMAIKELPERVREFIKSGQTTLI